MAPLLVIPAGAGIHGATNVVKNLCRFQPDGYQSHPGWSVEHMFSSPPLENNLKFLVSPWNVIDSKGQEMRKMGQMRIPWNVYENKQLNLNLGMSLINKEVRLFLNWGLSLCG